MRSTFSGLEIAKRSLFAQQTALQTTGHNIANASTVGYTRQTVNLVASRPMEYPGMMRSNTPGQIGTGVEFDSIRRIRESFLDVQYRNEQKSHGNWQVQADTLDKLESIINEPSETGIRKTIEGFWNAWQELTKAPDDDTARTLVKERALTMTDAFNHTARKLDELAADLNDVLRVKAIQTDSLLDQIANVNEVIFRIEGLGGNANDLRDQRDLLVDELSKIINITVQEDARGYSIRMGNQELITGIAKNVTVDAAFFEDNVGGDLQSGEAFGLILSRDTYVDSYRNQLNSLIRTIADGDVNVTLPKGTMLPDGVTVTDAFGNTYTGTLNADTEIVVAGLNGLHQLGYALDGTPGETFFTFEDGNEARTISVNQSIIDNPALIAASNRTYVDGNGVTRVVRGSNELASVIAGLRNREFQFDGSSGPTTMEGFFRSMIGRLGVNANEAKRQEANQRMLVEQADMRRQSISGVSLDEEMANMIKFQHAYNAAARAMTTYDEMLDKIINGMGVVGR